VRNAQLISALDEAQRHRDELLRLNAELEEINQGVMALYTQLSDEMEQTNLGVVALYAELDERSAQLREANDAKSRFLRNVSHELRAPVTAILGMTRLVLDPRSEPLTAEQTYQLSLIQTSARDLLTLVNQLLDLAKAESNRLEPQWAPVDLMTVFGQLRGTLRPLARPSVELVVDDPLGVPPLVSDEVMLVQILRNLLTNALKFTDRGEVTLAARHDPATRRVILTVTDPASASRPTTRTGSSRSSSRSGTRNGRRPRAPGSACPTRSGCARCSAPTSRWPASPGRAARSPCRCRARRPTRPPSRTTAGPR
jgi:signal transduction histidine kinase